MKPTMTFKYHYHQGSDPELSSIFHISNKHTYTVLNSMCSAMCNKYRNDRKPQHKELPHPPVDQNYS